MKYVRVITHTLDDGTVLVVMVIGMMVEPQISGKYSMTVTNHVTYSPKGNGPPGRDNYTEEELEAHRGDERYVVGYKEEWIGDMGMDELMADMTKVKLERVWETDLFKGDGTPVYEPKYDKHTASSWKKINR